MALVRCGRGCEVGDLLVSVGSVDVKFVIVYADSAVGISRGDGDLEVGGEEVGTRGDFEGVDGGVLDHEAGLFGLEDGPSDEKDKKYDEAEDEEAGAEAAEASCATSAVAVALFCVSHMVIW